MKKEQLHAKRNPPSSGVFLSGVVYSVTKMTLSCNGEVFWKVFSGKTPVCNRYNDGEFNLYRDRDFKKKFILEKPDE